MAQSSSGSQVHETPRDDDGNLIAIYMANVEWHLLPGRARTERGTRLFVGGIKHLMNCSYCAESCQLATLLASQDLSQFINGLYNHLSVPTDSLRATVRWIINIICVGQKSVP